MADIYTLTADDLTEIRRTLIRDQWLPFVEEALSEYNRSYKRNFVEDTDLQLYANQILVDQEEELDTVWTEKYYERLSYGDDDADAESKADTAQIQALFRLIAARVIGDMLTDVSFRKVVDPESLRMLEALMNQYLAVIAAEGPGVSFFDVERA